MTSSFAAGYDGVDRVQTDGRSGARYDGPRCVRSFWIRGCECTLPDEMLDGTSHACGITLVWNASWTAIWYDVQGGMVCGWRLVSSLSTIAKRIASRHQRFKLMMKLRKRVVSSSLSKRFLHCGEVFTFDASVAEVDFFFAFGLFSASYLLRAKLTMSNVVVVIENLELVVVRFCLHVAFLVWSV